MEKLTLQQFLDRFDSDIHKELHRKLDQEFVLGMVLFECQQMDSSNFGNRTAMIYGTSCTYKSWRECQGQHLYDLPSQRQYAVAYYEK